MDRKKVVLRFFRENWKFWLSVCLAVAFFIIFMINYIGKEENRVTEPITVTYDASTNSEKMKKA